MGAKWVSLLTFNAFLSSAVLRWMHKDETLAIGLWILTNFWTTNPFSRTRTRPLIPRSRSSHVCHSPPVRGWQRSVQFIHEIYSNYWLYFMKEFYQHCIFSTHLRSILLQAWRIHFQSFWNVV
jgi:hypothetical protein